MFSKSGEYAIRAMIFIAKESLNGKRVGFKEVASATKSPEAFVAKILQQLAKDRLLISTKGPGGGFVLNGSTQSISIRSIVVAVDGNDLFNGCSLGFEKCSSDKPCPLHHEMMEIRERLTTILENSTLQDMVDKLDNKTAHLFQ